MKKKLHIHFFIFWLVALQLLSPFLHAHIFGVGAVNSTPGVHIHLDEFDAATGQNFNEATIHNQTVNEHAIGMITGVSEKSNFDFLPPVIVCFIFLALYLPYRPRFYQSNESVVPYQPTYLPSSPRAPPVTF